MTILQKYETWYNDFMNTIILKAVPILQKYHVKKASVFGSFARGEETAKSDIDFLIELPKGMSLFTFADLKMDLEETLQKEVDLVTYRSIHPLLKEAILKEQQIIYETN